MAKCLNCDLDTKSKFCSHSCSASYSNKRRKYNTAKIRICKHCKTRFKKKVRIHNSGLLCRKCSIIYKERKTIIKDMTLLEYQNKLSVKNKHPSWKNSHIRILNSSWNSELKEKPCQKCGYDKHVELCHIKSIQSFPLTATLKEINHPSNIYVLCPNCHWEFDNL